MLHAAGQLGLPPLPSSSSSSSNTLEVAAAAAAAAAGPPGVIARITRIQTLDGKAVCAISANLYNTAVLTAGELYMLGSNEASLLGKRPRSPADLAPAASGQQVMLGGDADMTHRRQVSSGGDTAGGDCSWRPVRLEALEPYALADVAQGPGHALAVTEQVMFLTQEVIKVTCFCTAWCVLDVHPLQTPEGAGANM